MIRPIAFPDQSTAPALGMGTWRMGEDSRLRKQEIKALRAGVDAQLSFS